MKYSTETVFKVWNDDTGDNWEIAEDSDGLGLVEIRERDAKNAITGRLTMEADAAKLLAKQLTEYLQQIKTP